jgi:hypothetical protein
MISSDTEVSSIRSRPVLCADLLHRIHGLNCDYLELLASEAAGIEPTGQGRYLALKARLLVPQLSREQRARLAAVPYALYSLRFDDVRFWRRLGSSSPLPLSERYTPGVRSLETAFCETALIQAWHIASTQPLAARLLYGMSEAVSTALAAAPLWQLKWLARHDAEILMPRWATNPCFWPDLIELALRGDEARLATAQLLGVQLTAAEFLEAGRRKSAA